MSILVVAAVVLGIAVASFLATRLARLIAYLRGLGRH
jgi:hypothetical protein